MVVKRWTIVLLLVGAAIAWCVSTYFTFKKYEEMAKMLETMPQGAPFPLPLPFPQKSNQAIKKQRATVDPNEGNEDFNDISRAFLVSCLWK